MTGPQPRTRGRRAFDIFAVVTLAGFAAFCAIITLCAARLPAGREESGARAPAPFRRVALRHEALRFTPAGDAVQCERVEDLTNGDGAYQEKREALTWPTGRTSGPASPRDGALTARVLRHVLETYGFADDLGWELALSPDHAELAYTNGGVLHRDAAGRWRSLTGHALPPALAHLSGRPGSLESREAREWADAAVGATLRDGVRTAVFADRLIRIHAEASAEVHALLSLLVDRDPPDADAEIARVVLSIDDAPLQKRLIEAAETRRREGAGEGWARRALLAAAVARAWGDHPTDAVLGWAASALEDGTYERLPAEAQHALVRRLGRHLKPSYAGRLARVVDGDGAEAALAGAAVLRRMVGEGGEEGADFARLEDARAWLAELRTRRPELFRE